MRRLLASASVALVLFAGTSSSALVDGGIDASILDGGPIDAGGPDVAILDGGAGDVNVSDGAVGDATTEAATDAATADASDAATIKDAKSDACDPNVEPCTTRADTGPTDDAGDNEGTAQNGGCSCDSAPAMASGTPIALLLVAFALMSRRRKR